MSTVRAVKQTLSRRTFRLRHCTYNIKPLILPCIEAFEDRNFAASWPGSDAVLEEEEGKKLDLPSQADSCDDALFSCFLSKEHSIFRIALLFHKVQEDVRNIGRSLYHSEPTLLFFCSTHGYRASSKVFAFLCSEVNELL